MNHKRTIAAAALAMALKRLFQRRYMPPVKRNVMALQPPVKMTAATWLVRTLVQGSQRWTRIRGNGSSWLKVVAKAWAACSKQKLKSVTKKRNVTVN